MPTSPAPAATSFTLPEHVEVSPETLRAIAARHGIPLATGSPITRLEDAGIVNAAYCLGTTAILRIPRHHPSFIADGRREAVAVPAARAAGVRTPALLAFDDSLELVPVPYTLYERVEGVPLESLHLDPAEAAEVWREHGRTLAVIHAGVPLAGDVLTLRQQVARPDLPALVERRAQEGWFSPLDARWMTAWLARLAPAALGSAPRRFLHGDTQATNLLVSPEPLRYEAVIDWGSASIGDPALDFAGVPLRAVPFMLDGYREIALLDDDATAEARIVWRHLQLALEFLPRGAVPGRSWAERPLPMLLEVLRFFLDPPDRAPARGWRAVGPVGWHDLTLPAPSNVAWGGRHG